MTKTLLYRMILTAFIALNCLFITTVTASPKIADVELQLSQVVQELTLHLNTKYEWPETSLITSMSLVYGMENEVAPADEHHVDLLILDTWLHCLALIDQHIDENPAPDDEPSANIRMPLGATKSDKIYQQYVQKRKENDLIAKQSRYHQTLLNARHSWHTSFEGIIRGYFPKPDNANLAIIPHKIKAAIPEGDTRDQLIKTLKRMWGITEIQSK